MLELDCDDYGDAHGEQTADRAESLAGRLPAWIDLDNAAHVTTGGLHVLIASGGSPTVAQTLRSIAAGLSPRPGNGSPVAVHDIVAPPSDDPRGAGLAAGSLPLVLGGMIAAVLLTRLRRLQRRRGRDAGRPRTVPSRSDSPRSALT